MIAQQYFFNADEVILDGVRVPIEINDEERFYPLDNDKSSPLKILLTRIIVLIFIAYIAYVVLMR